LLLVSLASRALRVLAWVVLRALPARRHAVVHGWPDNEANAVEVVRGLVRRYPGRICWLVQDRDFRGPDLPHLQDTRLVRLGKNSLAALWASLTAEVTFYTHGLSTAVTPTEDRLVVNLWHGDGPKSTQRSTLVKSTVVVSGAALWAAYKGPLFGVPADRVLVTGNPRIDQFDEPLPDEMLTRLGLARGRRRVLWLPTYRQARGPRDRSWSDGARLSDKVEVHELAAALGEHARSLSMDLVIKPHPLDVDVYDGLGCSVVRGEDLDKAGVGLYQLLGQCDALVSDVSSAWVDYLVLDRPIGFYVPDLAELERGRGLNVPDFATLMPGLRIEHADHARDFLDRVAAGAADLRPSAYPGFARIGAVTSTGATDRLLDALSDFQRARGRDPLFQPRPQQSHGAPAAGGAGQ
jgi:CDP-glycerol glycerophosphotransferase